MFPAGGGFPVAKIRRVLVKLQAKELSQQSESLKNSIVCQLIVLIPSSTILYEPTVRTTPAAEQGTDASDEKKQEVGEGQIRSTSYQAPSPSPSIAVQSSSSFEPTTSACSHSDSTTANKAAPATVRVQPLAPVKPSEVYKWQVCSTEVFSAVLTSTRT